MLASLLQAAPLAAQSETPLGIVQPLRSLATFADSIATAGDSARAYAVLDSALRKDKRNAAAWHSFGILSWNMARSARNGSFVKDARNIRLLANADSALRLATKHAPDSARYWLTLSRFNITSGVSTMRFASGQQSGNAYEAATKTGEKLLLAEAASGVGMAAWRRFEAIANRSLVVDQQQVQFGAITNRSRARDYVESFSKKIEPPTGNDDYLEAEKYFREAVAADSVNQRYSRQLYMALAERKRWDELRALAALRSKQFPLDFQSQLALGLAHHRLEQEAASKIAFDSAFAVMDDPDRDRISRFSRILRPKATKATKGTIGDSASFLALPPGQRRGYEEAYWFINDPLAITNENEFRLEFLSRVVYADFRWSVDETGLLGADSDRGDIFVRYGPPDYEANLPGNAQIATNTLVWSYRTGLTFFFELPPGFSTARFAFNDRDAVDQIRSQVPVSWSNLQSLRFVDTIPVRATRFRAGGDSADVIVAATIPIDSLVHALGLDRAAIDLDFRTFDQFVRVRGAESNQTTVSPDSSPAPLDRSWTRRLGPGINIVRVEALQADSKRAARAVSRLTPAATSGFDMSDVLLGTKPTLRDGVRVATRWSDVSTTPSSGDFPQGSVGLLWEIYELTDRDGQNRYKVSITVERAERGGALGFAVRALDGIGRAVGQVRQGNDRFIIAWVGNKPASATQVEFISLEMGNAPTGLYRLRVVITDDANNRKSVRNTEFRIR